MTIYAMTPKTTIINNKMGGDFRIHCTSLSGFAGSLVGLVDQAHTFLCTSPQDIFNEHFSFSYDGVEVTTYPSKHTELLDEVSAMLDLLPAIYGRLDKTDPKLYKLVGSFRDNQVLRDFEYRLKEAKQQVTQQLLRDQENALDMAYIRDLLASCHTQPLVKQALAEGWTREQNKCDDFFDYCQGDGWHVFDPSKVDARTAVRQFEPTPFVVDLSSLMLSTEQIDTLVKDLNEQTIVTAKHEKGVVIYYTPYYVDEDEDEPHGF